MATKHSPKVFRTEFDSWTGCHRVSKLIVLYSRDCDINSMETCIKCKKTKSIEDFNFRNREAGIRNKQCRECTKATHAAHYSKNRKKVSDANSRTVRLRLELLRQKYDAILSQKACDVCGMSSALIRLIPPEGKRSAANLLNAGNKWQTILTAIEQSKAFCEECSPIGVKASQKRAHKKKSEQLGMPFGTASAKLSKMIMLSLVQRLELDRCFRCDEPIVLAEELSKDHKVNWQDVDPALFWDLDNIAFSHSACNSRARHNMVPSSNG